MSKHYHRPPKILTRFNVGTELKVYELGYPTWTKNRERKELIVSLQEKLRKLNQKGVESERTPFDTQANTNQNDQTNANQDEDICQFSDFSDTSDSDQPIDFILFDSLSIGEFNKFLKERKMQ